MIKSPVMHRRGNEGNFDVCILLLFILCSGVLVLYFKFIPMYFNALEAKRWVGMEAVEMTPSIKKQFNIQSSSGVLVARTFDDSPARLAGILEGDVIRRWNGISITGLEELQRLIQTSQENEKVKMTIDRQGVPVLIYINVGIRP